MKHFPLILTMVIFFSSCDSEKNRDGLTQYSTNSDSTLFYYNLGWKQIMDFGDYSKAEASYRKALSFDNEFLVGQSVLARLTLDLEERLRLYKNLESLKNTIKGDERLILDVYMGLTRYANLRDQDSPKTKDALNEALKLGEINFHKMVHKYPEEIYLKSEYIEIIHSLYGARASLDSIESLTTKTQKLNPFILGYKAILTAEIEKYDDALKYANQLTEILADIEVARPDAILANIYFQKEEYRTAKIHADKAYEIDSNNLDASRLKQKIDAILSEIQKED